MYVIISLIIMPVEIGHTRSRWFLIGYFTQARSTGTRDLAGQSGTPGFVVRRKLILHYCHYYLAQEALQIVKVQIGDKSRIRCNYHYFLMPSCQYQALVLQVAADDWCFNLAQAELIIKDGKKKRGGAEQERERGGGGKHSVRIKRTFVRHPPCFSSTSNN